MDEVAQSEPEEVAAPLVGERLKTAREAKGMTLEQVATETRIPLRQLQAIEDSQYDKLPAPAYSLGFVKAYARTVGEDEVAMGQALRGELSDVFAARQTATLSEPPDPARIPSKGFAWALVLVPVLLIGALLIWRFGFVDSDMDKNIAAGINAEAPATVAAGNGAAAALAPGQNTAPAVPTSGTVVITAVEPVWIGVKGADKKSLVQKELKVGESYTVPADAQSPILRTGRPQAIKITVAGKEVPPQGKPDVTINIPVDAASLSAMAAGSAATGNATPAPGNGA